MRLKTFLATALLTSAYGAGAASVSGTIKTLYGTPNGEVAIKLNEGFSEELINAECPGTNGFAGNKNADPFIKSMLLTAYVSQSNIRISIVGCEDHWLRIANVYLEPKDQ